MPIAEVPARLRAQTDSARNAAESQTYPLIDDDQRQWWTPEPHAAPAWDGNPTSLTGGTGVGRAFDRSVPNEQYVRACQLDQGGRLPDRMVAKLAVDYLAAMERAYRAQYASSVRCRVHATARRIGHADDAGPYGAFLAHLDDTLAAGYATANAPPPPPPPPP